jgi:carbon monoxide dehydrogenase subunit G
MNLEGNFFVEKPRAAVWALINDPEVLRQAIPGCQSLEAVDEGYEATVAIAIGPVKAKFNGRVKLQDVRAPESYRISGEGSGGIAGFAKGGANVRLEEINGGTTIHYAVDAAIGGKLAQLGSRLIESTSRKLSGQFFERIAEIARSA